MSTALVLAPSSRVEDPDQRVILDGIDWWQFETFLAIRGDHAGVGVTYLVGSAILAAVEGTRPLLPVEDDGACDHLAGMEWPEIELPSTRGRLVSIRDLAAPWTSSTSIPARE